MEKSAKIYVAGHRGMVGSAICRALSSQGYNNLVLSTSRQVDLRNQQQVNTFFSEQKPDYVFMAAAKVGGIEANNTYRADFLYDNLMIEANVIHASYQHGVNKLLFLGSSCIYPKLAPQPMAEDALLTGPLEATNEPYAIAKIAGIKLCDAYRMQHGCNFISLMPTNLYGVNDNYDLQNSHVLPAMLRKFHQAKINNHPQVTIWGSGTPLREFMYADDLADAAIFLMNNFNQDGFINVGTGQEVSIAQLAQQVKDVVGYTGNIVYDSSRPDGTPRKLMDSSKLHALGWRHKTSLAQGLKLTYNHFLQELQHGKIQL